MDEQQGIVKRGGNALAYAYLRGVEPTFVFFPGFASDMHGTKAIFLRDRCAVRGQAMLRFDYAGHGNSGGSFIDGTIGSWVADAKAVIEAALPKGRKILIGSSMGAWIALLLARGMATDLAGFVGIAPAPDFTEDLIKSRCESSQRAAAEQQKVILLANRYGPPTPISRAFLEDARQHLVLRNHIPIFRPVRLIHGQRDTDVPWQTSLRLADRIDGEDVQITLVKDGEHRLSRAADLALIDDICSRLSD